MTAVVTLREATTADLAPVTALYADEVTHGTATFETTPPSLAEMTGRYEAVRGHALPWLIAERDGVFAGYAYASPFRPRAAYRWAVEGSIYVAAGARGAGVGKALLTGLIEACRAHGMRHVIGAISDSANVASVALHVACGFREVGIYRQVGFKFDRWLDVTLMQLDLTPEGEPPTTDGLRL